MFRFFEKLFGRKGPNCGLEKPIAAEKKNALPYAALIDRVRRGEAEAIEKLGDVLVHWQDEGFRTEAARALANVLDGNGSGKARSAAAWTLRACGSRAKEGKDSLVRSLEALEKEVRFAAAAALCEQEVPGDRMERIVAILSEELRTGNEAGRLAVAEAVAELGAAGRGALEALRVSLEHGDEAGAAAARALGAMGADAASAAEDLAAALRSKNRHVRSAAAEALGAIGPAAGFAASALIELLEEDGAAGSEAFTALNRLGGAAVPALGEALATAGGNRLVKVLHCLGFAGPAGAAVRADIAAHLRHEEERVREAAERALSRIGNAGE